MHHGQYSPEVKRVLMHHSDKKEQIFYNANPHPWSMPQIGPRPPYYYNPRYEKYYPVI